MNKITPVTRFPTCLRQVRACAVALLFGIPLSGCLADTFRTPAQQANGGAAIGNLKGIRVSIPQKYRFFSVIYEGEDTWRPETKRKAPATFDTPISSFSILVRLPNMEPLSPANEQSWRDFQRNNGTDDSWIDFEGRLRSIEIPPAEWQERALKMQRPLISKSHGWELRRLNEKRYGLTVEVQVGPDKKKNDVRIEDLLYDQEGRNTLIECGTGGTKPAGAHFCHQFFLIPEMNLFMDVRYRASKLPEWSTIQANVTSLVNSFRTTR